MHLSKSVVTVVLTMNMVMIIGVSCTPATPEPLPTMATKTPVPIVESPTPTTPPTVTPAELTQVSEAEPYEFTLPVGNEATIDGVLSPGEWDPAGQVELTDGGELLLMYREGFIYLGVRSKPEPVTSVCIDQGDQVSILHSSAALGTAIYQRGDVGWQKKRDFEWCCRETSDSPQAEESRSEQLQQENWLASNGRMGTPEEVEFKILMSDRSLRLGVTSIGAPDYDDIAWWPPGMTDDCRSLSLIQGSILEEAQFIVENWMTLMAPNE